MSRNDTRKNKKTDIPIPEPRHRVGPKGVSSGISFRDLPPPSLDEIKKICEHYQTKCAGTYKSLASRYVYQMANEIEHLVDALKDGGYDISEGSLSTVDDAGNDVFPSEVDGRRSSVRPPVNGRARRSSDRRHTSSFSSDNLHDGRARRSSDRRNVRSFSGNLHESRPRTVHGSRPLTAAANRQPSNAYYRRSSSEFPSYDSVDTSADTPPRRSRTASSCRRRESDDSLTRANLEDQNEEVLRWLREEMKRSQALIKRSKQLHDEELVNAKKEVEKVKKAAKLLIKAVHKKGKEKAAKSEANAESEKRRRVKSQQMIESLIQSHSAQIDLLKRGLHRSPSRRGDRGDLGGNGRFYPWGELLDDRTDVSFSLSDASDLTSVLDDLAEEAYQQRSCC